ncbi:SMC-Scp complex subunit ScpB [Vaginisenegalia massiliensis]|uniref:SMC-Scp complex subunit ScpB n=1 Tax=Vaginisenegalia massiliensis TaxID=2058294 RepID=UPI000F545DB1|nr:SMC-Scp complex subunit ScpB [Vaginisenegalia massiliensis]
MSLVKKIYGILFVAGSEGVSLAQLQTTLGIESKEIEQALQDLKVSLTNQNDSPLELSVVDSKYRLITKSELEEVVEQYAQSPMTQHLTRAAIETLAIVAYRQPVTRMDVDQVRGVSSVAMIQKLLARDLIKEVGRLEAPGRPVLYGVTPYFMDYFGLSSLNDLPEIEPLSLNSQEAPDELFSTKKWQIELFDLSEEE